MRELPEGPRLNPDTDDVLLVLSDYVALGWTFHIYQLTPMCVVVTTEWCGEHPDRRTVHEEVVRRGVRNYPHTSLVTVVWVDEDGDIWSKSPGSVREAICCVINKLRGYLYEGFHP